MDEFESLRLIIVAVPDAKNCRDRFDPVDVEAHVDTVSELFRGLGADEIARIAPTSRSHITHQLREWARSETPRSTVIYWIGHGEIGQGRHFLVTDDTTVPLNSDDSVSASLLREYLSTNAERRAASGEERFTAVILDCCKAGDAVHQICAEFDRSFPQDLGLLGATDRGSTSFGRVPAALIEAVKKFGDNGDITTYSLLHELGGELGSSLFRADRLDRKLYRLRNPRALGAVLSGTQDVLSAVRELLARLEPEVRSHFLEKAQGAELNDHAWYFSGRARESEELASWLRDNAGGMFITAGLAGTGKSAFLGRMVTLGNRRLLDALVDEDWLDERPPDDQLPPEDVFDVVVHLSGKSLGDTTARIAERVEGYDGDPTDPDAVVTFLADALLGRFTVLVDALDESTQPGPIAASLLRRLAVIPGVRVVVGTRQSLQEDPDDPVPKSQYLIDALAPLDGRDTILTLTDDPVAQHEYVVQRLKRASGYNAESAGAIADMVTARAGPFLFARLAAIEIGARQLQHDSPELTGGDGLLDGNHRGLFQAALRRFDEQLATATPLLRTLAYSFGRGFPEQGGIWITAARALHPHIEIGNADITEVRRVAAPYIAVDGDHGQTTYRLAHRTFAECFHAETEP